MRVFILLLSLLTFHSFALAQTPEYESQQLTWPSTQAARKALHKKMADAGWQCFPYSSVYYCSRRISSAPAPVPSPSPAPSPSPTFEIVRFRILDANNNPIMNLTDGQVIDRASLPLGHLVFDAVTNPATVGSVRISVPALNDTHSENGAPYTSILFSPAQLPDRVEITAQAYAEANLGGTAGQSRTIRVSFSSGTVPSPTPSPSPSPVPSPAPSTGTGKALYVTVDGSGSECTLAKPCSFDTVLAPSASNPVRPGDTVYLRAGRFFKNVSHAVCNATLWCAQVNGTKEAPITYRSYPGELATLDTTGSHLGRLLTITGDYNIFRDLEFTMSSMFPGPYGQQCSSTTLLNPRALGPRHSCAAWNQGGWSRGNAIEIDGGDGSKVINNIIHDTGQGFFAGIRAPSPEFYGNIVFYNGFINTYFEAGQRHGPSGHGHAAYVQTETGMRISDNIMFGNFNFGVHAYGTSAAPLVNMVVDRNISYSHGAPAGQNTPNLLIGSGRPIIDGKVRNNHFYRPLSFGGGSNCQFGYYFSPGVLNESAEITGNRCIGGDFVAQVASYKSLAFTDNHIYGSGNVGLFLNQYDSAIPYRAKYRWDRNVYVATSQKPFVNQQNLHSSAATPEAKFNFTEWKAKFGFDQNSTFSTSMPKQNEIFIYPNEYEKGRANIVIYNWQLLDSVQIDLSSVLKNGEHFELRNAERVLQDSQKSTGISEWAKPILAGVYQGPVMVNVSGLVPSIPVGQQTAPVLHGKEFAALLLTCGSCR